MLGTDDRRYAMRPGRGGRVLAPVLLVLALVPAATLAALDPPVLGSSYRMEQTVEQKEEQGKNVSVITDVRHVYAVAATVHQGLGNHATLAAPLRLTSTRSDIDETVQNDVTFQPRLDLALGDFDLGTVLVLRSRRGVFGAQVHPRLRVGDVTLDGMVEPRFELAQDPGDRRQIYTAALGLGVRASDAVRLGVRYRGTARLALGEENTEDAYFTHRFQPRLDLHLTDRFTLGTEMIIGYASEGLITAGGHLQPRLWIGDFVVNGSVVPLFVVYADAPQSNYFSTRASLGLTWAWDAVRLRTDAGGSLRLALGETSTSKTRISYLMGLSLQVDLAKAQ